MGTGTATLHPHAFGREPPARPGLARRAARTAAELMLVAVLVAGGAVAVIVALLAALVTAPLAALVLFLGLWWLEDAPGRRTRQVRARVRRRARALGLRVLASPARSRAG